MATFFNPLLPLTPPTPPDLFVCDEIWGKSEIISEDCQRAVELSPSLAGDSSVTYNIGGSNGNIIPFTVSHGTCFIKFDVAGPNIPSTFTISPSTLRGLAMWVISECVLFRNLGGFATHGLANLVQYTARSAPLPLPPFTSMSQLNLPGYPSSTSFVTATVTGLVSESLHPGDSDPMIPAEVAKNNAIIWKFSKKNDPQLPFRQFVAKAFTELAKGQRRGSSTPWWHQRSSSITDDMTYECSADLGSPSEIDCTQIEWNQLSPASDTLKLEPGSPVFLHSNTCYLAISASTSLVLTWSQIRTALSTLMTLCVQDPVRMTARGGRAYYEHQPALSSRRRKRGSDADAGLTGLNALPPHANLTLFQQTEPFVGVAEEMKSCTWMAVERGRTVAGC